MDNVILAFVHEVDFKKLSMNDAYKAVCGRFPEAMRHGLVMLYQFKSWLLPLPCRLIPYSWTFPDSSTGKKAEKISLDIAQQISMVIT